MKYPDSDIEAIRQGADIVQVVGDIVSLRRSGSGLKGLCPFHDERTPSFHVNPTTGFFHCFGACNEGGDAIDFVQQILGCHFVDAVELLANQFSIGLHPNESRNTTSEAPRSGLHELNEAASSWFAEQLTTTDAAAARELLDSRGFSVETAINNFGCGFAPRAGLVPYLTEQGYAPDLIVSAGLATQTEHGELRERFRSRLIWTIRNPFGKAIGFAARRVSSKDPIDAKFINTADTAVYRKSSVLYGFDLARKEMARTKVAIVVEGYTDVMAMHLAGIHNVVATCGTATTSDHLASLRRTVGERGEIVFAFDGDTAGRNAALKVYDLARGAMHRLSGLQLDAGMDPDEMRYQHGDEALATLVEHRRPLIECVLRWSIDAMPLTTAEDRRAALDAALDLLKHVQDPLLYTEYTSMAARRLGFDPSLVTSRLAPPGTSDQTSSNGSAAASPPRTVKRELIHVLTQSETAARQHLEHVRPHYPSGVYRGIVAAVGAALTSAEPAPWPRRVLDAAPEDCHSPISELLADPLPVNAQGVDLYAEELVTRLDEETVQSQEQARLRAVTAATDQDSKEAALDALFKGAAAGVE